MAANLGPEPAAIGRRRRQAALRDLRQGDRRRHAGRAAAPPSSSSPRRERRDDPRAGPQGRHRGRLDRRQRPAATRVRRVTDSASCDALRRQRASTIRRPGHGDSRPAHRHRRRRPGRAHARGRFAPCRSPCSRAVPPIDTPGYHTLRYGDREVTIAVAPPRCVTIGDIAPGQKLWGIAVQLYSLKRAARWRHRRHDGLGHARAGSGEAGRRRHCAQPDAQPVPRRSRAASVPTRRPAGCSSIRC